MRVTQSMLSSNMLRNLNSSYGKMSKLQDQINSGKKITRPSDDPVITIKGMGYRTDLGKVEQFIRNTNEANAWMDTTDDALAQVGDRLKRVQELVVQAANGTNTAEDRDKIKSEMEQIQLHMRDVANTKISDKYIFSGTNTQKPLYKSGDSMINPEITAPTGEVRMEVFDGIQLTVNSPGKTLFSQINSVLDDVLGALTSNDGSKLSSLLGDGSSISKSLSSAHNSALELQADIGAKQNRLEIMENRLSMHEINVTKQMSNNEDVDYAEAITQMTTHESIHQAALSVGAKIIQQTLVDFMR
ncbi:flagellar hook-associated protein FlgL [Solibacillus sp. FSL H8-0538]|uniref:flagellar hook-associated protein FlgL n=1 Tax=Solibacillus sp. FSL H8-0538 TaxID=2921400 RepID=UPI0030F5A59A